MFLISRWQHVAAISGGTCAVGLVVKRKFPAERRPRNSQWVPPLTHTPCFCETTAKPWLCSQCGKRNPQTSARCELCGSAGGGSSLAQMESSANVGHSCSVQEKVAKELAEGCKDISKLSDKMNGPPQFARGFAAEEAHAHTFNADAIEKGSPLRAYRNVDLPGGRKTDAADVLVKNTETGETVKKVQIAVSKSQTYLDKKMANPKYDGMQKVVPEGMTSESTTDRISVDGVESDPMKVQKDAGEYKKKLAAAPVPEINPGKIAASAALCGGAFACAGSIYRNYSDQSKSAEEKIADVATDTAAGALTAGVSSGAGALATQIAFEEGCKASSAAAWGDAATGAVIGAIQSGRAIYDYSQGKITAEQRDLQVVTSVTGTTAGVTGALVGKAVCAAPAAATGFFAPVTYLACVTTFGGGAQMAARAGVTGALVGKAQCVAPAAHSDPLALSPSLLDAFRVEVHRWQAARAGSSKLMT